MTILEFKEKLNTIYQTLFDNHLPGNDHIVTTYFEALHPFINALPGNEYPFFAFREATDERIQFRLGCRHADLFMVKKNEMDQEDPIVSIQEEQDWTSYEFNLTTLLLTEYVHWVSAHTNNKLDITFTGYGIFVPVKKYWNQFFNPFSYPNKIWIGKDIKSVIYIRNETGTLTCLAYDAGVLKQAHELLTENNMMQEKIRVINEKIAGDGLKLHFVIDSIKKSIPATFLPDEPGSSKSDYEEMVEKSKQTLETLFYKNEIKRITEEIAVEITESAYEGQLKMQEYADLKEDLAISEIHFFEEDLLIVFLAPNIFLQNTINVQVDYALTIQDLSIDM